MGCIWNELRSEHLEIWSWDQSIVVCNGSIIQRQGLNCNQRKRAAGVGFFFILLYFFSQEVARVFVTSRKPILHGAWFTHV